MPRADENAVEEKSAECQRQHREDAAENFAATQIRMLECAHKPQGEQHQPERDHRQVRPRKIAKPRETRSEEHTSELQSRLHLVCRLLLEKKKKQTRPLHQHTTTVHQITHCS